MRTERIAENSVQSSEGQELESPQAYLSFIVLRGSRVLADLAVRQSQTAIHQALHQRVLKLSSQGKLLLIVFH